jgi:isocitrate lyase
MATQAPLNSRWQGIQRPYSAADVGRLRGSVRIEHSLARLGAEKFWRLLNSEPVIGALGCMTGNQAVQTVQAGLKAIYCSGWQVAGDANTAGEMYPDQSLYPVDAVPRMVETRCCAPTRFITSTAKPTSIGWRPLLPTPKPALAAT